MAAIVPPDSDSRLPTPDSRLPTPDLNLLSSFLSLQSPRSLDLVATQRVNDVAG
jgi:hypothetical protein